MTLSEFALKMEAYNLREVDHIEKIHAQAFLNQSVQATTGGKKPKPVYDKFSKFYDTQKEIDKVRMKYEKDYKPKSNAVIERKQTDLINKADERFREFINRKGVNINNG